MEQLNFTKFINFLNDLDDFYEKGKRTGFKTESLLNSSYSTEQQFNHALINEVFPKELLQVMSDNILFNEPLRMIIGNKPLLEGVKGESMQKVDPRVQETINNVFQSHLEPIIEYLRNKEKIFTYGKTEAVVQSKYNFNSKDTELFRNEKKLQSSEKTVVTDDDDTVYNLDNFEYLIETKILKGNKK